MREEVILVNALGHQVGTCEKMEAHRRGLKHRAFSVFIFNSADELLLQKRSPLKYHSGGLWTNTCCGHPRPGEQTTSAARRRLNEEMAIDCGLREMFWFSYEAPLNGLTENEVDHVFFGRSDNHPRPDTAEVSDWKRADCAALERDLTDAPDDYTVWLRICFGKVRELMYRMNCV